MTKTDKTHAVPRRIYGEDIPKYLLPFKLQEGNDC